MMQPKSLVVFALLLSVTAFAAPLSATGMEKALERQLRGAWGVLELEVYSACSGYYTNNHASVGGVTSKAGQRFAPGEVVKIDKLNLKRARLDLFLTLTEPVLLTHADGPFELYDEAECQVQLMIDIPRPMIRSGEVAAVMEIVRSLIQIEPSLEQARSSSSWNQRAREQLPEDYELTLARHAVWKAEQTNTAVAARTDEAIEDALRAADDIDRDPSYLDGFAAGVEEMDSWYERDCEDLVDMSFAALEKRAPSDRRGDDDWCDGFRDGQRLLFNLRLLDHLKGCFVPVPPPPIPQP